MRIVFTSDTHSMHDKVAVPDGDVFVHAGDLTMMGRKAEYESAAKWINALPHKHKIVIAGNHDFAIHEFISLLAPGAYYLENFGVYIDGVKFWGSPITPRFGSWAYGVERGKAIAEYWSEIPNDIDVLITHGPPMGILDQAVAHLHSENLGCADLRQRVKEIRPRVHVFGHIHGGYGRRTIDGTQFCNVSAVNEAYRPVNAPMVVDLVCELQRA